MTVNLYISCSFCKQQYNNIFQPCTFSFNVLMCAKACIRNHFLKTFLYIVCQNIHTYEVVHEVVVACRTSRKEAYNVYCHGLHWVFHLYCVKGNTLIVTVIIMHIYSQESLFLNVRSKKPSYNILRVNITFLLR